MIRFSNNPCDLKPFSKKKKSCSKQNYRFKGLKSKNLRRNQSPRKNQKSMLLEGKNLGNGFKLKALKLKQEQKPRERRRQPKAQKK